MRCMRFLQQITCKHNAESFESTLNISMDLICPGNIFVELDVSLINLNINESHKKYILYPPILRCLHHLFPFYSFCYIYTNRPIQNSSSLTKRCLLKCLGEPGKPCQSSPAGSKHLGSQCLPMSYGTANF